MYRLKCLDSPAVARAVPFITEKEGLVSIVPRRKAALQFLPIASTPYTASLTFKSSSYFAKANLYGMYNLNIVFEGDIKLRMAHTDVTKFPDFSDYRHKSNKDPKNFSKDSEYRRVFGYTNAISEFTLNAHDV